MPDKKVYLSDIKVNHISILSGSHKPANKQKVVIKSEQPTFKIKVDKEIEGLVYGTVMVVEDADTYGEHISRDDVKKAAHSTMKSGKLRIIDTNHDSVDNDEVAIVESYLEKDSGNWNIVVDISGHEELMKEAKEGNLNGFSFAGMTRVVEKNEKAETKEEFWEMPSYRQIQALTESLSYDLSWRMDENWQDDYLKKYDEVMSAHRKVVEFIIENEKGNAEKKKSLIQRVTDWFKPKEIINKEKEEDDMAIEDYSTEELEAELAKRKMPEDEEEKGKEPTDEEIAEKEKAEAERVEKEKAQAPISRSEFTDAIKVMSEKMEKSIQDLAESVSKRKSSQINSGNKDMNDWKVVMADPQLMKKKKEEDPAGYEVMKRKSQGR